MMKYSKIVMLGFMAFYSTILMASLIYSIRDAFQGGHMSLNMPVAYSSLLWSVIIMVMALIISISSYGDKIAALFLNHRKTSLREEEKINPALDMIKKQYRQKFGSDLDMKVYVMDEPHINGIALGKQTAAVSTGLLKVGTEDEIMGVMAHEAGHLHHKDGVFSLVFITASLPTVLLNYLLRLCFSRGVTLKFMPTSMQDFGWLWGGFVVIMFIFFFIYFLVFLVLSFPVLWLMRIFETMTQWPIEYKADQFANELGHGEALIELFERIEDEDIRAETGFLRKYLYSHPPTALRIGRIERSLLGRLNEDV